MSSAQVDLMPATIRLAERHNSIKPTTASAVPSSSPNHRTAAEAREAATADESPEKPTTSITTTADTVSPPQPPTTTATTQPPAQPGPSNNIKRPHGDDAASSGAHPIPAKKARASGAIVAARKKLFIYGNYDRYYGYRNAPVIGCSPDFGDIRLDAFRAHPELFEASDCLDIGCNQGAVAFAVASRLGARSVVGIDIDKSLVGQARQQLAAAKRKLPATVTPPESGAYPHNVCFNHGNYVLGDESLLALERPQFDTILCLSVSKWMHLNFGDAGLKLAFRRMFAQLRCGGRLVLEAQGWQSYKRRKKLTPEIEAHFAAIQLQPAAFEEYLLGPEVGFVRCWRMEAPRQHAAVGFRRPILVFEKPMTV